MIFCNMNKKDYFNLILQWLFSGIVGIVIWIFTGGGLDKVFICMLVEMLYLVCLSFSYNNNFVVDEADYDIHYALRKATRWYLIILSICAAGYLLPYRLQFYLIASAILCSILPKHLGIAQAMLAVITIHMCGSSKTTELIYALILVFLGMLCSSVFEQKKYSFQTALIITGISIAVYFLCNYSFGTSFNIYMVIHGLAEGILNMGLLLIAVPYLTNKTKDIKTITYGEAIEDDFSMVLELKTISDEKYRHGRMVSLLCYKCAGIVGINANLACCAGLYYCLNASDVNHPIEHLQEMSDRHNLPLDVRRLLYEYHGILKEISTPEAALVDLVDEVICGLEEKGTEYLAGFNRQMLIMNIFEELSSSGRYDSSGLSINMFLKIRKFLIEEADFNENLFRKRS